ncbi:MAG: PIN domain-containing protein [Rhizobiales bacterium]|nr:PIN domain-containing protein [Hyphomicrobiales bacterium]
MKFLLDTHYAIKLVDRHAGGMHEPDVLEKVQEQGELAISVASLWEVAIKSRLGKLPLLLNAAKWPSMLAALEIPLLRITHGHVLAEIGPLLGTNDPFDRLLLGICVAEDMRLVTADRALIGHQFAWRQFP